MLGVFANYHDLALTLDDLAFFADLLHRRFNLHRLHQPFLILPGT